VQLSPEQVLLLMFELVLVDDGASHDFGSQFLEMAVHIDVLELPLAQKVLMVLGLGHYVRGVDGVVVLELLAT